MLLAGRTRGFSGVLMTYPVVVLGVVEVDLGGRVSGFSGVLMT